MSIDDRDKNEEIKEEQPIVQEHIKPNYKRKLKKLLEVAVLALVAGLIFGLAVRLVLGDRVKNILRSDEEHESVNKDKRSEVTLRPSLTSNEQKTTPAQTGKQPISFVIDEGSDRQPDDTSAKTADKSSVSDAGHSDKNEKATEKPENDVPESGKSGNEISGDNKQENEIPENNTADGNPVSVTSDVTPVPDDGKGENETTDNTDVQLTDKNTDTDGTNDSSDGDGQDGSEIQDKNDTSGKDGNPDAGDGEDTVEDPEDGITTPVFGADSLNGYRKLMEELHGVAEQAEGSLVGVRAVSSIVNWMGENVETVKTTVGVVAADNGVELLVVTYYDKIKGADKLVAEFADGEKAEGTLLASDENFNMAVVAVPLETIPGETLAKTAPAVFGNVSGIYPGMPIIALGSPNGVAGSVEYGFITGTDSDYYMTDAACSIFTTDITNSPESEGIIVDLNGGIVGVISRKTAANEHEGISTGISVESLVGVAQCLCNGMSRPYFGITAEDVPADALAELSLQNGIYVKEVDIMSPAEVAEIHKGDIIVSFNGVDVVSVESFSALLTGNGTDEPVQIGIYRSSSKEEPELTLTVNLQ